MPAAPTLNPRPGPMAREIPEVDLDAALRRMRWAVLEEDFALAGFPEPPDAADLELVRQEPAGLVREGGETTLLVRQAALPGLLARRPHAAVQRDLAWIRFELPMDWELVGFLARVTGALAAEGVPLGAVCGYSRDHLFVARPHLARARLVLSRLIPTQPR